MFSEWIANLYVKNTFCPAIQNLLTLRSTRALRCILAVRLSPESGNSGYSIFTSIQIIFNKFAMVSLT